MLYLENIQCHGAKRAIQIQGLPEMPIRGIHLRNISIEAEQAVLCQDARDISFTNVEVVSRKGPFAELINSRKVTFDGLTYAQGSEVLFNLSGKLNADIIVRHTDTQTIKQPVTLSDGAERNALKLE